MATESEFVAVALEAAQRILSSPLSIRRGAPLLYAITVDNNLDLTVSPKSPVRGDAAFETDLCVFEEKREGVSIPRVVLEFKQGISTHDVLTYSAKARKHKQVYPYLRYGLVVSNASFVPRRFFIHNEALDFFAALMNEQKPSRLEPFLTDLLRQEIETSRRLEAISFGSFRTALFRTEITAREWASATDPGGK